MDRDLVFISASEGELNKLAHGNLAGNYVDWGSRSFRPRLNATEFGVVAAVLPQLGNFTQPLALIVAPEQQRRLFGRFSTIRGDLSPLTSWCHVFSPAMFDRMEEVRRFASLGTFASCWSALAVAEASLASERRAEKLMAAAATATQSFALARTLALWPAISSNDVLDRYDQANLLLRSGTTGIGRLRPTLEPIWRALRTVTAASNDARSDRSSAVRALMRLHDARREKYETEHLALAAAFDDLPEVQVIERLSDISPEDRVQLFDHLVHLIADASKEPQRHSDLSFLAGYLCTVAAGGSPSLGLAESVSKAHPQILAWAYVVGSVGENVTWTSSFEGLGRLISRELLRQFSIDDAPVCDFAIDEAVVLTDPQLKEPLVHLKLKQSRVVSVALFPGVNVSVPLGDQNDAGRPAMSRNAGRTNESASLEDDRSLRALADALWPHLVDRVLGAKNSTQNKPAKRVGVYQRKLPLEK